MECQQLYSSTSEPNKEGNHVTTNKTKTCGILGQNLGFNSVINFAFNEAV